MNRRDLFKGLVALVGGCVLEEAIPFGRVWSFPSKVTCVNIFKSSNPLFDQISALTLQELSRDCVMGEFFRPPSPFFLKARQLGFIYERVING